MIDYIHKEINALQWTIKDIFSALDNRVKVNEESITAIKEHIFLGKNVSAKDTIPLHLDDSSDDDSDGNDGGADVYKIFYRDTPERPICQASPSTPARDPSPETLDKNDSTVSDLIDRVVLDTFEKEERANKKKKECQAEKVEEKEKEEDEEVKQEEEEEGKKGNGKEKGEDKDGERDGRGEGDGKSVREGRGESGDRENEGGGNTEGEVGEKKVKGDSHRGGNEKKWPTLILSFDMFEKPNEEMQKEFQTWLNLGLNKKEE